MTLQEELRKLFHDLSNKLNNISISAGVKAHMAELKNYDAMSKEELLRELKVALEGFSQIEKTALEAGELSTKLKENVYTSLNMKKSLD